MKIGKQLYTIGMNRYNRYFPLFAYRNRHTYFTLTLFRCQFVLNIKPAIDWTTAECIYDDLYDAVGYIGSAQWLDGRDLTDDELDWLNDVHYESVSAHLVDEAHNYQAMQGDALYDAWRDGDL